MTPADVVVVVAMTWGISCFMLGLSPLIMIAGGILVGAGMGFIHWSWRR